MPSPVPLLPDRLLPTPDAPLRPAPQGLRQRLMWLNNDRVFYAGLLGEVTVRTMGSWLVYASLDAPLRIRLQGAAAAGMGRWQRAHLAVVRPYVPHQVACDQRRICCLTIEPETIMEAGLPRWMLQCDGALPQDGAAAGQVLQRVQAGLALLGAGGDGGGTADLQTAGFDAIFFNQRLAARQIDPRIARVLEDMRNDPARSTTAQQCAAAVGLSFSRFLHLFKAEVGTPFRSLRTWKRARSLLHHVTRDANLVHVALDTGYPDSTHFSHSIRQAYGLRPRDLFAGSRRLTLLGDSPAARAAARAECWR